MNTENEMYNTKKNNEGEKEAMFNSPNDIMLG